MSNRALFAAFNKVRTDVEGALEASRKREEEKRLREEELAREEKRREREARQRGQAPAKRDRKSVV